MLLPLPAPRSLRASLRPSPPLLPSPHPPSPRSLQRAKEWILTHCPQHTPHVGRIFCEAVGDATTLDQRLGILAVVGDLLSTMSASHPPTHPLSSFAALMRVALPFQNHWCTDCLSLLFWNGHAGHAC